MNLVPYFSSIPYSKEENGIVERGNKEVNRHIRNILSDHKWPQTLYMTERLLNLSVKQPLEASQNALLFGNATVQEPGMIEEMDQMPSETVKTSTREYIDKLLNAVR